MAESRTKALAPWSKGQDDLLSRLPSSARRAKLIQSSDEHADRDGQTLVTDNPGVIRAWAEARGAKPATTTREGRPRVLRFDFPGYGGGSLRHITWDEWLSVFQERRLAFMYQETLRNGNQSNFFRLNNPAREDA